MCRASLSIMPAAPSLLLMSGDATRTERVLLVTASNRRRGAEVYTEQLAGRLQVADRWELEAVSLTRASDEAIVSLRPLTDVSPDSARRFDSRILRSLRSHIRRQLPDVVVAMGGSTLRYAVASNIPPVTKLVYFAIGEPRYWLKGFASRLLNRGLVSRVDHVIAVSEMTATQLTELNPALDGNVSVARTGVEDGLFAIEASGREHDLPLRVLFIGSLSPEKDPLLAIDAVAHAEGCTLRLVGDGPMRLESELAVADVEGGDRFEFVGAVDDVRPHLEWADLVLLTSRTEGLPGVVLEAAAAGIPSVGVDVGGVSEAIEHRITGLVVERNSTQLAAALATLEGNRDTLQGMGQSARERARHMFRLDDSVARFADVLEKVTA